MSESRFTFHISRFTFHASRLPQLSTPNHQPSTSVTFISIKNQKFSKRPIMAIREAVKPEGDASMVMPLRVLLVEGSAEDAAQLVGELQGAGFDVTSERVDTVEGVQAA